jgi:hypothetical protein
MKAVVTAENPQQHSTFSPRIADSFSGVGVKQRQFFNHKCKKISNSQLAHQAANSTRP